jgi:hypothetical protein
VRGVAPNCSVGSEPCTPVSVADFPSDGSCDDVESLEGRRNSHEAFGREIAPAGRSASAIVAWVSCAERAETSMTPFVEPTSAGTGQGQLLVAVREERAGCLCLVDGALPAVRAILAVGTPMQFEESGSRILPVENDKRRSPASAARSTPAVSTRQDAR